MNATPQAVGIFLGPKQADTDIADKQAVLETLLKDIAQKHQKVVLASSLAAEDNILFDAIARLDLPIQTFCLNTGRLHAQTLEVAPRLTAQYKRDIQWYAPNEHDVAEYVKQHGLDAFYQSLELRKACCGIRKVAPLKLALAKQDAWLTGQRQAQAQSRTTLPESEWDATHGLHKYNPLATWTEADVWTYIRKYDVPVNALHFQGFASIGCEPCTRAISIGEDIRAGRWWWEDPQHKECGLHNANATAFGSNTISPTQPTT